MKNHKKAFGQMKAYYNDITGGNLQVIKDLQKRIELKENAVDNKKKLLDYVQENQKLSGPWPWSRLVIAELQALLRERTKDQMALRIYSRLSALGRVLLA